MQTIYKILHFVFTEFKHGLRLAKAVADVTTVPPPPTAVKEEDAWNSNPTLLMAGAFGAWLISTPTAGWEARNDGGGPR